MGTIDDMKRKLDSFVEEIKTISEKTITIIPDSNGMIDRQCPKDECKSLFKVNTEDWENIFRDEEVFCPYCRNKSKANEYLPDHQRDLLIKTLQKSIIDNWNYDYPISKNLLLLKTHEEYKLNLQCEKCNVRFSVVGVAYFCPNCGFNFIEKIAANLVEQQIKKAENITLIKKSLKETFTDDEATVFSKSIIENSVADCIGILQNFCEIKYNKLTEKKAPFNAFQNIETGNKLWMTLTGQGYETWLLKSEVKYLNILTNRRHILEHKSGFVDSKYIENTNDKKYTVGERIIVQPNDVIRLGKIILKLINSIKDL